MDSNKIDQFHVDYIHVKMIVNKKKTLYFEDEELDIPSFVDVEIPLRKPKIGITIGLTVPEGVVDGAHYLDNNQLKYLAVNQSELRGEFACEQYRTPESFILFSTNHKEGQ